MCNVNLLLLSLVGNYKGKDDFFNQRNLSSLMKLKESLTKNDEINFIKRLKILC